jgi:hypothetical protein
MLMVAEYPVEVLTKQLNVVENYLTHAMQDANSETRVNTRKAFLFWEVKEPRSARKLYSVLDNQV